MALFGIISIPTELAQKPDFKQISTDFRNSITSYKEWSDGFWTGWALDTNQKFQVGDKITTQDKDSNDKVEVITQCPAEKSDITIIHSFDTARFIPISGTPVELEPVEKGTFYGYNVAKGVTFFGTTDAMGKLIIYGCQKNQLYRANFYPKLDESDIKRLYDSYLETISTLNKWLESQWNGGFDQRWDNYTKNGITGQMKEELKAVWNGIISVLEDMWEGIKLVFDIIANPKKYKDKILSFFENLDWEQIYTALTEGLSKALTLAQDKGLMFILVSAIISWFKMLPPQDLTEVKTALVTEFLIGLLVGVVLTGGAGLAVRFGTKVFTKASGGRGATLLRELADFVMDIFKGRGLSKHADDVKPFVARGEAKLTPNKAGDVKILDDKTPDHKVNSGNATDDVKKGTIEAGGANNNTVFEVENKKATPNNNDSGKTLNDKPTDSANKTCTNNCPVSMVTGEELLTLTDGTLQGLLPFNWTRLYRTSAAELDTGLGYGWSHSLSHSLRFEQEQVIWTDHENRQISFPLPTEQCPAYTNNLASAAIYLGNKPNEYILVQTDEQKGFYHFTRTQSGAQLEAISDNYGNKLFINRDLLGKIKRIHNGAGTGLLLRYHNAHIIGIDYQKQIAAATEEGSWQTIQTMVNYHYNKYHQLIKTINAADESEHYTYDELNVIQQRHLAGGAIFYWQWKGEGKQVRCIRHWANFEQMEAHYDWDDNGTVTVTRKDGSQLVYTHDENAKLIKQIDANGAQTLKDYDANGNLIIETNPLGAQTYYEYDEQNRLRSIFPAEAEPTHYFYSRGFLKQIWQGKAIWHYKHNEQGNIIEQTDPHGHTTHYDYTATGKIKAIHYPDGSRHQFTWNKLGQLIEETLPQGGLRRYRYDALGRQIIRQDERGQTTHYEYDPLGCLSKVTEPNRSSKSYRYNAYGKITQVIDQQGHITHYDYAEHLHLISQRTNSDGSTVHYQYNNAQLNLTDIINEQGERYHLDYYSNGLISQEIGFDGRKTGYQYDMGGNLVAKTDYDDQDNTYTTTYLRSPEGKLIQKTLPDGKQIDYTYNDLGLLATVDDQQWPLDYEYDITGKLTAEHQGWATLRYQYSPLGILSQCKLPDGNIIDYQYQKGGQLAQINLNDQKLTEHFYSLGQEVERQQGSLTSQYDYDEQGRLKTHFVNNSQKNLYQRKYQYSANGNLAAIEDSRKGIRQYHYDPLDRLVQVRGDISEDLIHDPAGNLLAQDHKTQQANVKGNRLLMQGDKHFTYDSFGNLIQEARGQGQKLVTQYQYDSQQQLIKATMPDGTSASYQYDAFGRRISKTVTDKTGKKTKTEFIWFGDKLLAESSKGHYQSYLYELGTFKPLALLKGKGKKAEVYYYQLDHLGTPQELTAANGAIAWSAKYKAYGNLALQEQIDGIEQPLRFQGQYNDLETGLYYNRNRYYSPDTGRYITLDPIKLAGGLNSYQYCTNPTSWIDPLGLNDECPGLNSNKSTTPEEKVTVDTSQPDIPGQGYHKETYGSKPVKPEDATQRWEDFLGEGPYTNTHPRTGQVDPDRIVSADGTRSIRYGNHEMNSSPTKQHYHEETWTLDPEKNVMNVDNIVIRIPSPPNRKKP